METFEAHQCFLSVLWPIFLIYRGWMVTVLVRLVGSNRTFHCWLPVLFRFTVYDFVSTDLCSFLGTVIKIKHPADGWIKSTNVQMSMLHLIMCDIVCFHSKDK